MSIPPFLGENIETTFKNSFSSHMIQKKITAKMIKKKKPKPLILHDNCRCFSQKNKLIFPNKEDYQQKEMLHLITK